MVLGGLLGGIAGGAGVVIVIKAVDEFSGTINKATGGIRGLGTLMKVGVAGVGAFGIAMTALGVSSLKAAGDFEQTQIAFTTMLGSGEKAQKFLEELADFAKKTPFTLTGVERSARQLLAVGFEAEDVLPVLKNVGDVAAGLGLGEEGLQRLILNLGQVQSQGKLTGRELRDFAVAGIPLLDELAKELGVTTAAVSEMVSAGEIETDIVLKVFENMTSAGGRFEDLMAKQAETVQGKFSNLADTFELMRREIGSFLLPVVADFADVLLDDILPTIQPLIPLVGEFLANAFKTIADIIVNMIPKLIEFAQKFFDIAAEIQGRLAPILEELIPLLLDLGLNIFEQIMNAIIELLPVFEELLEDVLIPLIPSIGDLITKLLELIPIILNETVPAIVGMIKSMEEWMPVLIDIISFVGDLVDIIKDLTKSLGDISPFLGFLTGRGFFGNLLGDGGGDGGSSNVTRLNDFILTPNGRILQPSPDDTIIGTKGGIGNTIIIHNINGMTGRDLAESLQRELNAKVMLN